MTPDGLNQAIAAGEPVRVLPGGIEFVSEYLSGAGSVLIPIVAVSSAFPDNGEVELKDESGHVRGSVHLLRGRSTDNTLDLTDTEYVAYLSDVDDGGINVLPYTFRNNYVSIESDYIIRYFTHHFDGAPLWGGFIHRSMAAGVPKPHKVNFAIEMQHFNGYPTEYHQVCSLRSVTQAYGIERFLKLYHMVELLFDWDYVEEIRSLNDDLEGVGKLLSRGSLSEFKRIEFILMRRCDRFDRIAAKLSEVHRFIPTAASIFFEYGKDSNPLKRPDFLRAFFAAPTFSRATFMADPVLKRQNFDEFVAAVAAHWIYRIRCSIAHHKIGEYLLTERDEQFVVEFGEPLLREILCQAMRK